MNHQDDDRRVNPSAAPALAQIAALRLSRRSVLAAFALGLGAVATGIWHRARAAVSSLNFAEIGNRAGPDHAVAAGYRADVLIRWGDPVLDTAPDFVPGRPDAAAQEKQFGYNNDYIAFMPLPRGSTNADHGLLCINHEYVSRAMVWPATGAGTSKTRAAAEMAAHGISVVEVERRGGRWRTVPGGAYARRITATTPFRFAGPAAASPRLRTGREARGTINNCAGGVTPWGTVLSGEENVHGYFAGQVSGREQRNHERFGFRSTSWYSWYRHDERFDLGKQPNEANRFGWVVEIDPYDPKSTPVKRTALGRFKHEGATTALAPDGRVVVYSGDDQSFEYLYRFVTARRFDAADPAANRNLLDDGTLSVARFNADGSLDWLPLVHGQGGLDAANDFASQADVLIEARRAGDTVGATPLDRPEDVQANPVTGRVYAMLTKNRGRKKGQIDAANPRARNKYGHILELLPPGPDGRRDHAADRFDWELFLLAGNPRKRRHKARYHPEVSDVGWLMAPDNCAFDARGRMWITSDHGDDEIANGVYACDTFGPGRALTRLFYKAPRGAECTGPAFTPDGRTLFVAVQHPGEGSTFDDPNTRWPDFTAGLPPRPSIVAITRDDGGEIGD